MPLQPINYVARIFENGVAKSDPFGGLRQGTTPKFGRRSDRLCEGHRKSAIASHLSLVEVAIAILSGDCEISDTNS